MMSGIEFSVSSNSNGEFADHQQQNSQLYHHLPHNPNPNPNPNLDSSFPPPTLPKKKRNLPGKPGLFLLSLSLSLHTHTHIFSINLLQFFQYPFEKIH